MGRATWAAVPLVFASGFCALIYQVVWTREFRLVFGSSTAASAAVVAIFIAGLGFGGLRLGRHVERSEQPLRYYAQLELAIAALSALTPWLLQAARAAYVLSGGTLALGVAGATVARLLLALLVLGAPTFLMGGTLPALARAVESPDDPARRRVALIYGANTLGAVLGCALATFVMLEVFGARTTLWIACLLNLLVAVAARATARGLGAAALAAPSEPQPGAGSRAEARPGLVLASAAVVGFAFFLMELVWYRLLGPLLGGTVFTFGLILAVALLGIGLGGVLYTLLLAGRQPRLSGFALTCLLEAGLIALPYALGDRIALWALLLRPLGGLGFSGLVFGWALVAGLVVLPAALVAGLQFPMLIALLGRGRDQVGRDVGRAYAANTLGAIAGALAGGFGLLPALGALGCWRLAALLLCGWGALTLAASARAEGLLQPRYPAALVALAATLLMLQAQGPSAAFRHTPIGIGRAQDVAVSSANEAQAFLARCRRAVLWEADGIESAVALDRSNGLAFIVNGKSDGNARGDAATQVMAGLVGAALLPKVRSAMVIGLGTGSTAGWLAKLPEIERVDVAEIEPAIVQVAARCGPVNEQALRNPKLQLLSGDARELLAVSRRRYDLIFSEPSNPYRAGIASMYTREFYRAAAERLAPGGILVQWMQAYEVDTLTLRNVYATLSAVFPYVESWRGMPRDLLLVGSQRRPAHDAARLRARIAGEPFARAMRAAWRSEGLEGFLGHYVANASFARAAYRANPDALSTDDLSPIEFGFGRNLRSDAGFTFDSLIEAVRARAAERPAIRGAVDWARVDFEREAFALTHHRKPDPSRLSPAHRARFELLNAWQQGDQETARARWLGFDPQPGNAELLALERLAVTETAAFAGSADAEPAIVALEREQPTEAAALRAVWLLRRGDTARAARLSAVELALRRCASDPWPLPETMARFLRALGAWGTVEPEVAPWLFARLARPFAVHVNEEEREQARLQLALVLGSRHRACLEVFTGMEPNAPWSLRLLQFRAACYAAHGHALAERAAADLAEFVEQAPASFGDLLSTQ